LVRRAGVAPRRMVVRIATLRTAFPAATRAGTSFAAGS
jgi:hypothetical protein